jgi:Mlc titration factor MtfA (ptsG expression regulator)
MDDDESDAAAPGPQDREVPAPAGLDNRRPGLDHQNDDWDDMPAYAFTNEQEFFAVSAEYFFKAPRELAARHPQLYDMLRQTFRQDPARIL